MNAAFVQALADCQEEEAIDLYALRLQCIAKIAAGGGEIAFTTRAGLNGKAAEQEARCDASDLLGAVNQAIRIASGTAVSLTYADFSAMPRY